MKLADLKNYDLGEREVSYSARDAILYALSVGAPAVQLDLVYERDLRVLPTYACALGLWAVESAGALGAYDRKRSLHASQSVVSHREMPASGHVVMRAGVSAVWDKGKATIVEVSVTSDLFTATYTIFLPGVGNWGGDPGPAASPAPTLNAPTWRGSAPTSRDLAALYRLTGDLHPIHIDPEVARANGFDRPILHGLCTLGIAARMIAEAAASHPCDLRMLKARMSAPVSPGETISVAAREVGGEIYFQAEVDGRNVLKDGVAAFDRSRGSNRKS